MLAHLKRETATLSNLYDSSAGGACGRSSSGSDPSASELHGSAASAYTQTFSYNIFIFIAFYFNIYIFIREKSKYTVHLFTFI